MIDLNFTEEQQKSYKLQTHYAHALILEYFRYVCAPCSSFPLYPLTCSSQMTIHPRTNV